MPVDFSATTVHEGRVFGILRAFRQLLDSLVGAITSLEHTVHDLVRVQQEAGPALDRLEALELSRHQFEAEVQGALLAAKGKLKASLNSEARERHLRKQNERDADPLADLGEEIAEGGNPVQRNDAAAGEAERVSALRLDVAPGPKAAALKHKWSG